MVQGNTYTGKNIIYLLLFISDSEIMYHKMIKQICDKYNKKYSKDLQIKVNLIKHYSLL